MRKILHWQALKNHAAAMADVFNWSSRSWVLGALLSLPIIDGGRNKVDVTRSEAALEESVAAWREQVLVAFAEVEDNLAGVRILAALPLAADPGGSAVFLCADTIDA
jgi:outer membrane protein TolC